MEYLVIVGVCLIMYYRSLRYGLCVDDISAHKPTNRLYWTFDSVIRALNGCTPINNLFIDHGLTIVLHTTVCLLMQVAFNNLPATLIFSVLIGNTQVSVWLNGKRYAVSAILCLLAYIFAPFGVIGLLLLPFFQVSGFLFPLVLALMGYVWILPIFILIPFVGKNLLITRIKGRKDTCKNEWFKTWTPGKICLILKTYAFYFFRTLIPVPPILYLSYLKMIGLSDRDNHLACKFDLAAFAGLCIIITIPILYVVSPVIFFGAMWWLILISIWNNFVTYTVTFAERYIYLPSIGLLVTFTLLLDMIHPNLWMLFFGIHAGMLYAYLPMYKNLDSMLKHHISIDPHNDVSWNFLINIACEKAEAMKVLILTEEALQYNNDSALLWMHKAAVLNVFGNQQVALECVEKARSVGVDKFVEINKDKINEIEKRILNKIKESENASK